MLFPLLFMSLVSQASLTVYGNADSAFLWWRQFQNVVPGLSVESYGKEFITAFPENIAYYHPRQSNKLLINAFYDGTEVTITTQNLSEYRTLQSGQSKVFHFPKNFEQYQFTRSFSSVRVNSSKLITVLWISQRGDSVQSNYVPPLRNLGNLYSIPFINYNQMMASLYGTAGLLALDNWRCIVINAKKITNKVIIQTVSTNETAFNYNLGPYELFQFQTNGSEIKVYSNNTVAVLLTHPCVQTTRCDCNMVVNHVLPQNLWGQNFVVPSVKNLNSTWLQVTSTKEVLLKGHNIQILVSNSSYLNPFPYLGIKSQFITAPNNVSIRLISPGLILELMPETMFAACYLLQMNSTEGEAIIIAPTASKGKVYMDNDLLTSSGWRPIDGSDYFSISVSLSGTHVIWHPSSRIGVYLFERMESGIPYGGPAIILNEDPDADGCVADPALFKTATHVMTWPESHAYCSNETFQLSTPTSSSAQTEMSNFLKNNGSSGYFWIGLRRSLITLDWYWKIGDDSDYNVTYTEWATGHPLAPKKALCASVSKNSTKMFSWKSVSCCSKRRPLCYKKANYFNDLTFDALP